MMFPIKIMEDLKKCKRVSLIRKPSKSGKTTR